ncbi:MAG: PilZ domain-containing protein [Planctomycetota bacterium]|nr:PilZ domain-containing protein [Planctomycetota bacterium]
MARSSDSDQREHPRFRLEPGCAGVTVQRVEGMALHTLDGHAYDISISGARIELDRPLELGERLAVCLRLPGEANSVFASGRVVWVHDAEDDPAARRLAVQFTRFLADEDRQRLLRYVGGEHLRAAA